MLMLYFLGAADTHFIEKPRPILFHRADDEAHPYAYVTLEEAQSILDESPDLYAVKEAPKATVEAKDDDETEKPVKKAPAKKAKAAKADKE